jgi:hypothetical protein
LHGAPFPGVTSGVLLDHFEGALHFLVDLSELAFENNFLRIKDHVHGSFELSQMETDGFPHTPFHPVPLNGSTHHA